MRAIFLILFTLNVNLHALSIENSSLENKALRSDTVCIARCTNLTTSNVDGKIHTFYHFQLLDNWKGVMPTEFQLRSFGGKVGDIVNYDERAYNLSIGTTYLLNVLSSSYFELLDFKFGATKYNYNPHTSALDSHKTFCESLGSDADFSKIKQPESNSLKSVTASGLLDGGGERRYTMFDKGEPIDIVADISTLPLGISESQALTALERAIVAWEENSTARFNFLGTQNFSKSADTYTRSEGTVVRVQFHDNFNILNSSITTLAVGGSSFSIPQFNGQNIDGSGGSVDGIQFHESTHGYVILNHPNETLNDPATLENVLCHELGHVLGLAHSSETPDEANDELFQATMFYLAKKDGRGAELRSYDQNQIQKIYPNNPPPYGVSTSFHAITVPDGTTHTLPEINQITIRGGDLRNDSLTFVTTSSSSFSGTFAVSDTTVTYTPSGFFQTTATGIYDRLQGYFTDGINRSAIINIDISGFSVDQYPLGNPDGMPDNWMVENFGSEDGSTPDADADGDGLSNYYEFRMQTDPNNSADGFPEVSLDTASGELVVENNPNVVFELKTANNNLSSFNTTRVLKTNAGPGYTRFKGVFDRGSEPKKFFLLEYNP